MTTKKVKTKPAKSLAKQVSRMDTLLQAIETVISTSNKKPTKKTKSK